MIRQTQYLVNNSIKDRLKDTNVSVDFKLPLNLPTGDFFYDPWIIKDEYKDTVWEDLLSTLPTNIGEARLIKLQPGEAYRSHADMDDRYHFNIRGERSFIIYTEDNLIYPQVESNYWVEMNAGRLHSAVNTGRVDRIQLVVRKLLLDNQLADPVSVTISVSNDKQDYRYVFDELYSPWLNVANKEGKLNNFVYSSESVSFNIDKCYLSELTAINTPYFKVECT